MLLPSRYSQSTLVIIAGIVLCIMAFGIIAGVIAFNLRARAATVIRVPEDHPTIQAAIEAADPGDIIQVRAGTYNENITLNKAVTLTAETFDQINPVNNTTVIDGSGGASAIFIPPGLMGMPTIRGFIIQNSGSNIQASSPFIVEYNYLRSANHLINYQFGAGGFNRNNVYFGAADDAIHVDDPTIPLVIEYNRIMYATDDGIEINLQNTSNPSSPVEIGIWNNMIVGSREDGIQFIDYTSEQLDLNRRFVIVGNLIANSAKAGIGLMPSANTVEDFSGADVVEPIHLYNNTLYGNNHGVSGGDNLVMFNSIVANSSGRGVWRVQGVQGSNSVVAYTLFHNNGLDSDQSTLGAGLISGQDPLFLGPPNPGPDGAWETVDDDFTSLLLQPASPAVDRGVVQFLAASGESIPPIPIRGFTGTAPDLGWREYGSPAFITPTATLPPSPTLPPGVTPASPVPSSTLTFTPLPTTSPSPTMTPVSTLTASVTPATPTLTVTLLPTETGTLAITATPQLTIVDIEPNNAAANTTINMTIAGTGFVSGAVVTFEGGQGVASEVTSVQVLNHTTMTAAINVRADASFGAQTWDVRVTNPNGSTTSLVDAFTIIP